MLDEVTLEKRLQSLEEAVAELQRKLNGAVAPNWIERVTGSITDHEAFLEALEYGRAMRQSDRPTEQDEDRP